MMPHISSTPLQTSRKIIEDSCRTKQLSNNKRGRMYGYILPESTETAGKFHLYKPVLFKYAFFLVCSLFVYKFHFLIFKVQAWQCSRGPEPDDTEGEARSWCNGVHTALVALVEGRAGAGAATAARRALAAAWPLLLPTPQVRAHHLITLLPQGEIKIENRIKLWRYA